MAAVFFFPQNVSFFSNPVDLRGKKAKTTATIAMKVSGNAVFLMSATSLLRAQAFSNIIKRTGESISNSSHTRVSGAKRYKWIVI